MSIRRVGMVSLGCAKNRVDSEIMLGLIEGAGYEIVADPAAADAIVVNTCGFIAPAKEESIDAILEMAELKKKGSLRLLIVTGCLSQRYPEELAHELPEVDAFLGAGQQEEIVSALRHAEGGERPVLTGYPEGFPEVPRILTTGGRSAYLKIGEGCDNRCAYCAIPLIRGPYFSRPADSVLREAQDLWDIGVSELTLIAQDTTRYDEPGGLAGLLRALARKDWFKWIRVLYAYPGRVTDELLDVMEGEKGVLPYLDIPIQHVTDRMLRRMNRHDTRAGIEKLLRAVEKRKTPFVLRTTLMCGFPGETEADFREMLAFIGDHPFQHLGAFAFSPEEGTKAFGMDGAVPEALAEERLGLLMEKQRAISRGFLEARVGELAEVLLEGREEGILYGRSWREAPDDADGRIYVSAMEDLAGFVPVRLTRAADYDMMGEVCHDYAGQ